MIVKSWADSKES